MRLSGECSLARGTASAPHSFPRVSSGSTQGAEGYPAGTYSGQPCNAIAAMASTSSTFCSDSTEWMRRPGEHRGAIRNDKRNLSGDPKQPYQCPIDPEQRVLEQLHNCCAIASVLHPFRAFAQRVGKQKAWGTSILESAWSGAPSRT
jgi:hypothetical protein